MACEGLEAKFLEGIDAAADNTAKDKRVNVNEAAMVVFVGVVVVEMRNGLFEHTAVEARWVLKKTSKPGLLPSAEGEGLAAAGTEIATVALAAVGATVIAEVKESVTPGKPGLMLVGFVMSWQENWSWLSPH